MNHAVSNTEISSSQCSATPLSSSTSDGNQPTKILSSKQLAACRFSVTTLSGFTGTRPVKEVKDSPWGQVVHVLRPQTPALLADKKDGQFIVPCLLKEAPLVGNTLAAATKAAQPTIGKMRSKQHVTEAAMLVIDVDGIPENNFEAGLGKMKSDGLTYLAFTTHSHGSEDKPGVRVRLAIPLDRPVDTAAYADAWHGFDQQYWNGQVGKADPSGANLYQQQGTWSCHPGRAEQAKFWENSAGVASVDELIAIRNATLVSRRVQSNTAAKSAKNIRILPRTNHATGSFASNSGSDYPDSDANKVADACQQIGAFREDKGAGQSEPCWRDSLGVVGYCKNGENFCQEWSCGHPGYDERKTAEKLAYRIQTPPTTCAQFQKSNPAGCRGCTQQCKSPITLGWKGQEQDEAKVINGVKAAANPAGGPVDVATISSDTGKTEEQFQKFKTEVVHPAQKLLQAEVLPRESANLSLQPVGGEQLANPASKSVATSEDGPALSPLATIQKRYCLINMDGKVWVLDGALLAARNDKGTAQKLVLSSRQDGCVLIHRAAAAQFPTANVGTIYNSFVYSPQTICYDGVEFNPCGTTGNYLNLWVGPTITPKAGVWLLIQAFLFDVICDGVQESYDYLIRYIAHALQQPEEKPGVMIILLGGQGNGKGTFGRVLRKIWSATYLQISNIDNVTGNFNSALERAYIVFMDEALFSGNRRASDALKSLVTEETVYINEKFQPARQVQSYHRFIAATNADHFKNTERDDRRDFTLRVSEAHKGDHDYWRVLNREIEHGGVEAMVHDLQTLDLTEFNVREKPDTKELLAQKLQSLGPIECWWYEHLDAGASLPEKGWPKFLRTDSAIESIIRLNGGKLYRNPTPNDFVQKMLKLCPSAVKKQQQERSDRHRGLALPGLQQARTEFEQYVGGAINWDSDAANGAA